MLEHLPRKYRVSIWTVGLVTFAAVGGWLAWTTPVPLVWSSGAIVGAVVGTLAVLGFLHALERRPSGAPVRRRHS